MPGPYLAVFHNIVEDGCSAATLMSRSPHQFIGVGFGGPGRAEDDGGLSRGHLPLLSWTLQGSRLH